MEEIRGGSSLAHFLALSHLGSSEPPSWSEGEFESWTAELALAAGQAPARTAQVPALCSLNLPLPSPTQLEVSRVSAWVLG